MKMSNRLICSLRTGLTAGLLLAAALPGAWAQELPNKTITIVVGFAPGGAADHAAAQMTRTKRWTKRF